MCTSTNCFYLISLNYLSIIIQCHYLTGCYDGQLYILDADNGTLHWKFIPSPDTSLFSRESTSDPVKSSPCVDPASGLIWFGSHDHHIYAVDFQVSIGIARECTYHVSCIAS